MMRICSKAWLVFLFPPLLFTATAAAGQEKEPILIGATVSLKGKYEEPSSMIGSAFNLWEKQVNERGGLLGRRVRLILYDDKSREELVQTYYEKLIREDKVDFVLSPCSTPLTLVASRITESHKLVMLACGASSEGIWERGYRYIFGVFAPANRYLVGLLDLMARHGFESIGILYEGTPFHMDVAEGVVSWAKRFGLRVVADKGFKVAKTELRPLLKEVMDLEPHGLILSVYPPDAYDTLHFMKKASYRPRVLAIPIAPTHPDFCKRAGSMCEGIFCPSQWEPDERIPFPGTKNFVTDFRAFAKRLPSSYAGAAYAACQIMERAVIKTQSLDQERIRDYILSLDSATIIGRFKVDENGKQIGHNPLLIQWQDGKKEVVYPTKVQTAPARF